MTDYKVQMSVMIGSDSATHYLSTQTFTEEFFKLAYKQGKILDGFGPGLCAQFKELMDKAIEASRIREIGCGEKQS